MCVYKCVCMVDVMYLALESLNKSVQTAGEQGLEHRVPCFLSLSHSIKFLLGYFPSISMTLPLGCPVCQLQ